MGTRQILAIALFAAAVAGSGCAGSPPRTELASDPIVANRDAQELEDFRHKLARLRVLDPHQETSEFRSVAKHLFDAMERELGQADLRVQNVGDGERNQRMREIYEEVRGLRWGVARGNPEAIARGLQLLGEFEQEMHIDLEASRDALVDDPHDRRSEVRNVR